MITLDGLQIPWQVWKIITFMAIVAIIPVIVKIFKLMIRKTLRKVSRPIALEIEKYGTWIIWLIGVFFAIGELGLDIQILYMFIALAGVALIVAMRDALTNLMAGYYIDLYQPLKLGDWVKIGGYMGRIVKADGMNVTLLTRNNEKVIIPNSVIIKNIVTNMTVPGGIVISIPITVRQPISKEFEDEILKIGEGVKDYLVKDVEPKLRIADIGEEKIRMELLLQVANPANQAIVKEKVREGLRELFRKERT